MPQLDSAPKRSELVRRVSGSTHGVTVGAVLPPPAIRGPRTLRRPMWLPTARSFARWSSYCGGAKIPANLAGTVGPVKEVAASLVCGGVAGVVAASAAGFQLATDGNATFFAKVIFPAERQTPLVLFAMGSGGGCQCLTRRVHRTYWFLRSNHNLEATGTLD